MGVALILASLAVGCLLGVPPPRLIGRVLDACSHTWQCHHAYTHNGTHCTSVVNTPQPIFCSNITPRICKGVLFVQSHDCMMWCVHPPTSWQGGPTPPQVPGSVVCFFLFCPSPSPCRLLPLSLFPFFSSCCLQDGFPHPNQATQRGGGQGGYTGVPFSHPLALASAGSAGQGSWLFAVGHRPVVAGRPTPMVVRRCSHSPWCA